MAQPFGVKPKDLAVDLAAVVLGAVEELRVFEGSVTLHLEASGVRVRQGT